MPYHWAMVRLARPLFSISVVALAFALSTLCSTRALAAQTGAAVIVDSGDSDHSGFRIVVTPDYHANAVDGAGHASGDLATSLGDTFFADLRVALSSPPSSTPCTTSSQPQTESISVSYGGKAWVRVGCSSDPRAVRVTSDALAIARALYVQRYRMRPMYVYLGSNGAYVSSGQQPPNVYGMEYKTAQTAIGGYSRQPFTSFAGYGANPYTGYPPGSLPGGSLPLTSITGTLPTASLPGSSPYTGLPSASLPLSSPFNGSPYGSSPYSGGP